MNEQEQIDKLKKEGYDEVYVWEDEPNKEYEAHSHDFETVLHILKREIEITMNQETKALKEGDEIKILKGEEHTAKVGPAGCRYIVAEKHS